MTPFRIEHEFRGELARFWQVFFDESCMREQYRQVGVKEFAVLELVDEGETIRRTIHVVPNRDLPVVIRKITGATLGYTEHLTFTRSANRVDIHIVPSTLPERTQIAGVYSVTPLAPGRMLRVFEGSIAIDVPLLGRRIERTVLDDMTTSYAAGARVTQTWLDRA